jgi:hypothetical protein
LCNETAAFEYSKAAVSLLCVRLKMMQERIGLYIFKKRLAETIAWRSDRAVASNPAHGLRSSALRPPGLRMVARFRSEMHDVVQAVVDERAFWIHSRHKNLDLLSSGLANGRLLLCTSAADSTPDDQVMAASEGFYDDNHLPPWDTWLCYLGDKKRQYAVSWVPPQLLRLADIGVEEHSLKHMRWAEQEDTHFTRQLKTENLLH